MMDKIILALAAIGFGLMFAPVAFVGPNPPPLPGWVAFGCYPAGIILVAIAGKLCGPDE